MPDGSIPPAVGGYLDRSRPLDEQEFRMHLRHDGQHSCPSFPGAAPPLMATALSACLQLASGSYDSPVWTQQPFNSARLLLTRRTNCYPWQPKMAHSYHCSTPHARHRDTVIGARVGSPPVVEPAVVTQDTDTGLNSITSRRYLRQRQEALQSRWRLSHC